MFLSRVKNIKMKNEAIIMTITTDVHRPAFFLNVNGNSFKYENSFVDVCSLLCVINLN